MESAWNETRAARGSETPGVSFSPVHLIFLPLKIRAVDGYMYLIQLCPIQQTVQSFHLTGICAQRYVYMYVLRMCASVDRSMHVYACAIESTHRCTSPSSSGARDEERTRCSVC